MRVGDYVSVRGTRYRIVRIEGGTQGGKFFGKYRFYLAPQGATEATVYAYGKTVTGNSTLHAVTTTEGDK